MEANATRKREPVKCLHVCSVHVKSWLPKEMKNYSIEEARFCFETDKEIFTKRENKTQYLTFYNHFLTNIRVFCYVLEKVTLTQKPNSPN